MYSSAGVTPVYNEASLGLTWAASKQNSSGERRSVLTTRLSPLESTADLQYLDSVASVAFESRGPGASSSRGLFSVQTGCVKEATGACRQERKRYKHTQKKKVASKAFACRSAVHKCTDTSQGRGSLLGKQCPYSWRPIGSIIKRASNVAPPVAPAAVDTRQATQRAQEVIGYYCSTGQSCVLYMGFDGSSFYRAGTGRS